jgi:hypothetical protein
MERKTKTRDQGVQCDLIVADQNKKPISYDDWCEKFNNMSCNDDIEKLPEFENGYRYPQKLEDILDRSLINGKTRVFNEIIKDYNINVTRMARL